MLSTKYDFVVKQVSTRSAMVVLKRSSFFHNISMFCFRAYATVRSSIKEPGYIFKYEKTISFSFMNLPTLIQFESSITENFKNEKIYSSKKKKQIEKHMRYVPKVKMILVIIS